MPRPPTTTRHASGASAALEAELQLQIAELSTHITEIKAKAVLLHHGGHALLLESVLRATATLSDALRASSDDGGDQEQQRQRATAAFPGAARPDGRDEREQSIKAPDAILNCNLVGATMMGVIAGVIILLAVSLCIPCLIHNNNCPDQQQEHSCLVTAIAFTAIWCIVVLLSCCYLPKETAIKNSRARGTLEALVVIGWIAGCWDALVILLALKTSLPSNSTIFDQGLMTIRSTTVSQALQETSFSISAFLFVPSPIFFAALCWNNLNGAVLRLLWCQVQYKITIAWVVWLIVMSTWRLIVRGSDPVLAVCFVMCCFTPYIFILFLDAIVNASKLFRLALPALYLVLVLSTLAGIYSLEPTPIVAYDNNSKFPGHHLTFEAQIISSISVILTLTITFLCRVFKDPSGEVVLFPTFIAFLSKRAVPRMLAQLGHLQVIERDGEVVLEKWRRDDEALPVREGYQRM